MAQTHTPKIQPKTVIVHMDDYDCACRVVASFEALQALRMLVQQQIQADKIDITYEQISSQLEVIELAMRHAIEKM